MSPDAAEPVPAQTDEPLNEPAAEPPRKKRSVRRVLRISSSLVLLAFVILLIWPPAWGGLFTFAIVSGTSMEPTYHTGDVVVAMRSFDGYQVGDPVLYTVDQDDQTGRVVHRILEKLPDGNYLTNGDNKKAPDPWEVKPSWINGKVLQLIPQGAKALLIIRSPIFLAILCGLLVTAALWPRNKDDQKGQSDSESDDESESDADSPTSEDDKTGQKEDLRPVNHD